MANITCRPRTLSAGLAAAIWLTTLPAYAGPFSLLTFTSRQAFTAVLLQQGRVQTDADWNETGAITDGQAFGAFEFVIGPNDTQLTGQPGIVDGLAIGSNNGNLGGDESIHLHVTEGFAVNALGVEINFEDPLAISDIQIELDCPLQVCILEPDQAQRSFARSFEGAPGRLFFAVISDPPFAFHDLVVRAITPRNGNGEALHTVPGWQLQGISYARVPTPNPLLLLLMGLALLQRRQHRAL